MDPKDQTSNTPDSITAGETSASPRPVLRSESDPTTGSTGTSTGTKTGREEKGLDPRDLVLPT